MVISYIRALSLGALLAMGGALYAAGGAKPVKPDNTKMNKQVGMGIPEYEAKR